MLHEFAKVDDETEAIRSSGFSLAVVDQAPILSPPNRHSARYLATKRDKLGRFLLALGVWSEMN